jgi:DNA-binding transcriptional regulator YiaG
MGEAEIDFAAFVWGLRWRLFFAQEQFAPELGVSFSTLNVWENGRRVPLPFLRRRLLETAKEAGAAPGNAKQDPRHRRAGR